MQRPATEDEREGGVMDKKTKEIKGKERYRAGVMKLPAFAA